MMLLFYLCLIYLVSFPQKVISDYAWRDGTVVYYSTQDVLFARWPGMYLFAWGDAILAKIGTYSALAIEVGFSFFVWFKRTRVPALLAIMGLHLTMGILLEGVAMFNFIMLVALTLFLPWGKIIRRPAAAESAITG